MAKTSKKVSKSKAAPKAKRRVVAKVVVPPKKVVRPKALREAKQAAESVSPGSSRLLADGIAGDQRSALRAAPHGIVRARAGTGKTFTLIVGVAKMFGDRRLPGGSPDNPAAVLWGKVEKVLGKVVPSSQQAEVWEFMGQGPKPRTICYVAFNTAIVEEFAEKYAWLVAALDMVGVRLTFSTIHSLGNAACREHYRLRSWKSVSQYRVSDLLSAFWQKDMREVWKEKADTIQAIQELVGLCKLTLASFQGGTEDEIKDTLDDQLDTLATHYGILLNGNREEVFTAVRHLLGECRKVEPKTGRIDFNDMVWLPVVNNLPVEKFDLLLVDEAQDLNRCQQELVLKAGKRIILVGDERQAIYGFAGADVDSIDRMEGLLDHQRGLGEDGRGEVGSNIGQMKLTQTRRCGKAIVQEAQRLVPDFEAHPKNGPGKISRVNFEELKGDAKPAWKWGDDCAKCGAKGPHSFSLVGKDKHPQCIDCGWEPGAAGALATSEAKLSDHSLGESDMVLCRVNAPLVGLAFRMLKAGKRVNIKGRDIGTGLKAFIKKSKEKEVSGFLCWLDLFQQQQVERMQKRRNPDAEALVTLEDKCMCLRAVCDGAFTMKDVYENIDSLFQGKVCPQCKRSYDESQKVCYDCGDGTKYGKEKLVKPEGTLLSSVHRAKGLEAKRVFILRPDLMPHPKAKSAWEKGQEANLEYVAITRAIEELVYVDGQFKKEEGGDNA